MTRDGRKVLLGVCLVLLINTGVCNRGKGRKNKNPWSNSGTGQIMNNDVDIVPGIPIAGPTLQDQKAGGADSCVCVPTRLCDNNFNVIQAGEGMIDERLGPERPVGNCSNPNEICCRLRDPSVLPSTTAAQQASVTTTPTTITTMSTTRASTLAPNTVPTAPVGTTTTTVVMTTAGTVQTITPGTTPTTIAGTTPTTTVGTTTPTTTRPPSTSPVVSTTGGTITVLTTQSPIPTANPVTTPTANPVTTPTTTPVTTPTTTPVTTPTTTRVTTPITTPVTVPTTTQVTTPTTTQVTTPTTTPVTTPTTTTPTRPSSTLPPSTTAALTIPTAPPPAATTTTTTTTTTPATTTTTTTPATTTTTPTTPATTTTTPATTPTTPSTTTPVATTPTTPSTTRPPTTQNLPSTTTTRTQNTCGVSYVQPNELSNDPYTTVFAEFPWMAALLDSTALNPDGRLIRNGFICGASLLAEDFAMTAAHCIKGRGANSLFIRVGDWNTLYANESLPHQDRSLSRIQIHPDFDNVTLFNDVALLKLDAPVIFANNVIPICLPNVEDKFVGQSCIASGWGQNAFGPNGRFSTKMRKVSLPIIEKGTCQNLLSRTRLGQYFKLHESFTCAGGIENLDTCTGDGGGPLFCKNQATNKYVQAGIVSWGIGCGGRDVPGVYADVTVLKGWIDSTMYSLRRDQIPK